MLPSIALGMSVEKLRDGGSLCAAFQGANGSEYWLVLPVVRDAHSASGYDLPLVVERPFAVVEIQVSWPQARALLSQIEAKLPEGSNRHWVQPMYEAIRQEGKVFFD